ncbi:uncharacterized protein LOC119614549 [Lucilia sericata]|uniref:uncharacterized protein LOC119614549 n=1 Tax=Lucilia sericata TaxID=13632 RepID=UPI0018A8489A|nr:uncharacterized protein LOC119614549 [Lucilia sericata]
MWKLVEISQKSYFIYCDFNTNTQQVIFILYDLKEAWSQTLKLEDVKRKVKLLNKRFDFNEDNIKEALTSDAPHTAVIEDQPQTSGMHVDSCLLKLKCRVKNCFLNYEWDLRKQTVKEFQQTFVQPLLMAMLGCHQQVEILTESLRKKELELQQYRLEKGPLNRSTLTPTLIFDDFNKNTMTAIKLLLILKNWQNIKRKAKELKLQHLEKHLKIRRQGLEYESSQSQTPSTGNSQSPEETETNPVEQQHPTLTKEVTETKSNKTTTPRKSTRCIPTKQKWQYISSEDKTDSENDDNLAKLRERKLTRDVVNQTKPCNTNTFKEDSIKKSENNNVKDTKKASNLSYNNCQAKLDEKSSESSNVFDFSTDTEDDKPLKELRKVIENKKSMLPLKGNRSSSRNETPVVETSVIEISSPGRSKNLSHSPSVVVMDELSSQLSNIKKELESLEAMRLADLKQRMCKA